MKRLLIGWMICLFGLSSFARAEEKITWLTTNYPPAYILSGEQKGMGFCDLGGELFRQRLSAYQHDILDVSTSRMREFLKQPNEVYCSPGRAVFPPQYPDMVFSQKVAVVPPSGIVIRKADYETFMNAPNQGTSLETLFQTPTLIAGIIKDAQFGEHIMPLIAAYQGKPNLYIRTSANQKEYYQMLLAHRVDYVLDYAFSFFQLHQQLTSEEQAQLMFLPLREEPEPVPAYAMCNKTAASQAVIEQINAILLTEAYKTAVAQRLVEFLPENLRDEYRALNVEMIGK